MRSDITEGAVLPDYELPDHTDTPRRLSILQGDDPMVLTLHRGFFCPKDRQQLERLRDLSRQCAVGYSRLVSVTTDRTVLHVNNLRLGVGADWPFLYDAQRVIAKDLDIEEYTDPHNQPQIPHTFVLEPGLRIYRIYNGYWYWGRPSTAELHQDLREVTRRCRPDWRIDTPEMRARWAAGEREAFFPYGKSQREVIVRTAGAVDQFEKFARRGAGQAG
ncbi:MAG TPA: redoxin domain-containing protein [Longimicrobiales bacterium]|nr:redoxin domain-containing protein [Longimicrobiales bacterium]